MARTWMTFWDDMSASVRARTIASWVITGLAVGMLFAWVAGRSAWSGLIGCGIYTALMFVIAPLARRTGTNM